MKKKKINKFEQLKKQKKNSSLFFFRVGEIIGRYESVSYRVKFKNDIILLTKLSTYMMKREILPAIGQQVKVKIPLINMHTGTIIKILRFFNKTNV